MRLTVLNFLLRPISRGEFGQTERLRNSVLSAPSDKQVKWTVRPRYCGCQVTNPTSCILRLRKGTTRVNMRSHEGGESLQTAERKRLGEHAPNCQKFRGTDG